jgi:flagellar motor switch protein FliN/FliY
MATFDPPSAPVASEMTELQGFERVQDIPLELAVELGRTRLLIKDILELRAGSIVELEKMAGEPVDILANGLLVARGEVVVIEDAFGVRITEIITSSERKALAEDPSTARAA